MIVVWRVTEQCNLACPFCAYDKRLPFVRRHADPAEILRVARLAAQRVLQNGEDVLFSFLGGEPLTWRPLSGLARDIHGLGVRLSVTTNGTTLGAKPARQHLVNYYGEVTISVDGFSDFHDAMRDWRGGFGKLRNGVTALAREAAAMKAPLKLRANIVLMRQNVGVFSSLCSELAGWGISEITFNQLGGRDRPEFYPTHRLRETDVDMLARELPSLRRSLAACGTALIGGEDYIERFRASACDLQNPVEECYPGEKFLFVDEVGRISPCSFTSEEYGIDTRTLRQPDDLADLPHRFRAMKLAQAARACADCLSTQVCGKFQPAG